MDSFEAYVNKALDYHNKPNASNQARLTELVFDLHTHADGVPEFPYWDLIRVTADGAVLAPIPWKFNYPLEVTEGAWRVFFSYADNNGLYAGRGKNFRGRVSFQHWRDR